MPHGNTNALVTFQAMRVEGGRPGATFKVGALRKKQDGGGRGGFTMLEVEVDGEVMLMHPKDCKMFLRGYMAGKRAEQQATGEAERKS